MLEPLTLYLHIYTILCIYATGSVGYYVHSVSKGYMCIYEMVEKHSNEQ